MVIEKKQIEKNNIQNYKRPLINFAPKNPPLKKEKDKTKINVRYALISPFAFAHVYWDSKEFEVIYNVEEPLLDEKDKFYRNQIKAAMRDLINFNVIVNRDRESLLNYIDRIFKILLIELSINISYESYKKIFYYLVRDFVGFNEVDPLLKDYFIEDIECNGSNTPIFIVHRAYRNLRTNVIFKNMDYLASFVEKLAQRSGKYISYSNPILDGSLPGGSRINATYTKDITSRGPTFTIRKFTKNPWTPSQLVQFRTLSPEMMAFLWLVVQYRMNILLAGGTSSGKTTLLNALAFFIQPESRVVSIEDTRELNLSRENWLPSVTRSATVGTGEMGEIDLYALLRSSFRQNPDYVIVGEVRGKEAYVLFQGMASGHSSISTLHADSIDTVIKRLETPPIELSPTLLNVLDCVCVMTHAIVNKQETRKLKEIVEIVDVDSKGVATTNIPFVWNPANDHFYSKKKSHIIEKISKRYGVEIEKLNRELKIRTNLIYKLYEKGIFDFVKVQEIIDEYYKRPQEVLKRFGVEEVLEKKEKVKK